MSKQLKRYRVYTGCGAQAERIWEFLAFDDDEAKEIFFRVIPESQRTGEKRAYWSHVPGKLNGRRVA